MKNRIIYFFLLLGFPAIAPLALADGFISIRDGYFWDDAGTNYWIPRGFGYQTINPPVFATQTPEQIEYDLLEMRKVHANSLRVDFTWGYIEKTNDVFDWTATDHIVAMAEKYGLRLFPLIGYQYPPGWFPGTWKAINQSNQVSAILNYEHPLARAAYSNFISAITTRYKDSPAIAGWILGNEYAYFDLWEAQDPHLFVGYDTNYSLPSFRAYLSDVYSGNIAALNANWGTAYGSFNDVAIPTNYPGANEPGNVHLQNRNLPAYHDLIQWRKKSVGDFVALGAVAAKSANTNHLISYSMVGGIYSGFDANNTCEDAKTIVARCAAAGAPLDFWSVNNYAWALEGNELRSAQYGIKKYQDQSGLPVLVTETGHSSTENLFPGAAGRQANALPGQAWEALMAGAIGVHIFTWNDRPQMPQIREQGFGIVQGNRLIKGDVYWNIRETFRRMEQVDVCRLFGGSANPPADIFFYWGVDADMVWPRANQENAMLWGGLKRLGYEPRFLDEAGYDAKGYTNAPALLLSHAFMMDQARLNALTNVIEAGIHLHVNATLPGRYDAYHRENAGWASIISDLFGLSVAGATNTWHGGISGNWDQPYSGIFLQYSNNLGPLTPSYPWTNVATWIKMSNPTAVSGTTFVQARSGTASYPALHGKDHGADVKAAINTWPLGDTVDMWWLDPASPLMVWQLHYDWGRAIYRDWFGMQPPIDITGSGYFYVISDYRFCTNGSVLISLLNESSNAITITISASNLIQGLTVEQLSSPKGILDDLSTGSIELTLAGDEYVLLYAYTNNTSLANPSTYKVWISQEPTAFWPYASGDLVRVGYDTRGDMLDLHLALEQVDAAFTRRGETNALSVSGVDTETLILIVEDADLGDPAYVSSAEGGEYVLHAWLANGSTPVSHAYLPARLLWGVRPAALPESIASSSNYNLTLSWQELPSYLGPEHPTPLNRADVWSGNPDDTEENYLVSLHLLASNGTEVAHSRIGTSEGTASNTVTITTPVALDNPPYSWKALLTAAGAKFGGPVYQSFEDAALGDHDVPGSGPEPWQLQGQGDGTEVYLNRGTDLNASEGVQGSWQAFQSHNSGGGWSGYYLRYVYPRPFAITSGLNNVRFSFDFFEAAGLACGLEMHVKDNNGNMLKWTNLYVHTPGSWHTNAATLDQFSGSINTAAVRELVVLVGMLQASQVYVGHIDNIRFDTDEATYSLAGDPVYDVLDGFENYTQGAGTNITHPWLGFFYADPGKSVYWVEGVDAVASFEGSQSAFLLGQILAGATYSGHGFARAYTNAWALPAASAWSNISFQFTYRETNMITGDLLLKLEDSTNGAIEFRAAYTGKWQTIRATLNQFTLSGWPGYFNPSDVKKLVVLLDSKTFNGTYYARFDDIRFEGADTALGLGAYTGITERAWYLSINDSAGFTDGLPNWWWDRYSIPVGERIAADNPDEDGFTNEEEFAADTDPTNPVSYFSGVRSMGWSALGTDWSTNSRIYFVTYKTNLMDAVPWQPYGGEIPGNPDGSGVTIPVTNDAPMQFYRIGVKPPD